MPKSWLGQNKTAMWFHPRFGFWNDAGAYASGRAKRDSSSHAGRDTNGDWKIGCQRAATVSTGFGERRVDCFGRSQCSCAGFAADKLSRHPKFPLVIRQNHDSFTVLFMKTDIHPKYVDAEIRCACGNVIKTRSTKQTIIVGICNVCHPFYTGQQSSWTPPVAWTNSNSAPPRPPPPPRRSPRRKRKKFSRTISFRPPARLRERADSFFEWKRHGFRRLHELKL